MNQLKLQKEHKIALWGGLSFLIFVFILWYIYQITYYPRTDDAYVQANVINVAAQISGPVYEVEVQDNQFVKAGQVLFTIDPRPFQLAVASAEAQLKLTNQQVAAAMDQVQVANAAVTQSQAQLVLAQKNTARMMILVNKGLMPKAQGDNAQANLQVAQAALTSSQSKFEQAKQQLGELGENNAQVQAAIANLQMARLNLSYATITAPADGYITNFTLRPGAMVTVQQPLFALIESQQWWVNANYKETDLKRIHSGQLATIVLDIYPGKIFHGVVQGVSAGSGAAFALLPPENATGNWIKVTQRFPVRVNIIDPDLRYPLRLGASSTVTINTRKIYSN